MKLYLGVDGGQSSTKAIIGDETGRILGSGAGDPCNHAAAGEGRARLERGLATSLAAACRDAGLEAASVRFEAACFGMSGGAEDKREIVASIIRADCLIVTTDAAVALSGATQTGQGIIVIAGTGSIAYGRNAQGRAARAGGWGHIFGDEGGAFDMVRRSLRAALRMEEGWGPPTSLRRVLLEAVACPDANSALHCFYADGWPRDRVASLAPLVDAAATQGDAAAIEIVRRSAQELATLAAAVRGQLWELGGHVEIAYSGGVFQSKALAERFRLLVESETGNRCGPPLRTPAEGALLEARRAGGQRT
jgi:N-acetylglucosamine kinase-like BadF-type ATPase